MSKRFIDTGIFDDNWFMDLSKDAKLLWVYFITKCDHAGIIHLNPKLCQLQTGIKELETVRQQLGNRIITVKEQLYFIPKFVEFQYPGFPDCKFQMAKSAINILEKYGLIIDSQLTVMQELPNSYGNGNGISIGNGKENKEAKIEFLTFWNLYDKKEDRIKCEGKWNRLTNKEREECITNLPAYILSTPDKQFRKNPATYLNNKSWENEIIKPGISKAVVLTYEEILKLSQDNPNIWKQYKAVKRDGERKAIFELIK